MKIKKIRPLIIILSAVLLINICLQLLCLYFVNRAFHPLLPVNAPDSALFQKEHRPVYEGEDPVELFNQSEKNRCYPLLKDVSQKVSITSFDGLNLNAHLAVHTEAEQSHNYVILMHGFRDSSKTVSPYAMHFYNRGYNVLVPGQRGHGWSDGNFVDMSAFTPYDVKSWAEFLCQFDDQAKIALWGISMGGSTVMRATGLELPENVLCCVEDCGFSSMWDEFIFQLDNLYNLPGKILLPYFNLYIKRKLGFDSKKISAKDDLTRSVTPTLFIHGNADNFVPFYMLDTVYEAAACPREKLVIDNAVHARSAFTAPDIYWQKVDEFLDKYLCD